MIIDAEQVQHIAARLAGIDDAAAGAALGRLESPFMMSGLYDDQDGVDYALGGFRATAELFADAAGTSSTILFAIL